MRAIRAVAPVLVLLAAAAPALALEVDRATLRRKPATRPTRPRDSVKIRGRFDPGRFVRGFRFAPGAHDVRMSLGGRALVASTQEQDAIWRVNWALRWVGRLKGTPKVKLTLDFLTGEFRLAARRCDLGGTDPAHPDGLTLTLSIADVVFEGTLRFEERGRRLVLRPPEEEEHDDSPDEDYIKPPAAALAPFRILVDAVRSADDDFSIWENELVLRTTLDWINTYLDYLTTWINYPKISENEMVLTFRVPGDVFTVFEVHWEGLGLRVRYRGDRLPCCSDSCRDYELLRVIAVPKVPGPVVFERL